VGRQVGHAPPAARGAEAAALAGEGDQQLGVAFVAAEAGETAREDAAREELAELTLDEERQAVAGGSRVGEEALEMLAKDAVEDAVLQSPRLVWPPRARSRARVLGRPDIASLMHEAE